MINDYSLVFSANSFLGAELIKVLKGEERKVIGTTRRMSEISDERIYLDISGDEPEFNIPKDINHAYLLAGTWDYNECEKDPNAWKVNVVNMAKLAEDLLKKNIFVTFISTNTVFGGERPWCNENDTHDPQFPYGFQKSAAEGALKNIAKTLHQDELLSIVRLTKILDIGVSPLPMWNDCMEKGEILRPFSDLSFAPMSVRYTAESLAKIGKARISGNFHISGADNIGYVEFAKIFAERLGFSDVQVQPTTSIEMNVDIPFKPTYSGIGMDRTTKLIGLKPQKIDQLMDFLYQQYTSRT